MSNKIAFKYLQSFTDETEAFYSDVVGVAEKNLKSSEMKHFTKIMVSNYKADLNNAHKSYESFLKEVDKVDPDVPTKAQLTTVTHKWGQLGISCEVLDKRNVMAAISTPVEHHLQREVSARSN